MTQVAQAPAMPNGSAEAVWLAGGLILLAVVLVSIDVHLVGQGYLSVVGVAALALGALLLLDPAAAPPWLSRGLVLGAAVGSLGYAAVAGRAAVSVRRLGSSRPALPEVGTAGVAVTDLDPTGVVYVAREEWSAVADLSLPPAVGLASGQTGGPGGGQGATNRVPPAESGRHPTRGRRTGIRAGERIEVVGREGLWLRVRRHATASLVKEVRD